MAEEEIIKQMFLLIAVVMNIFTADYNFLKCSRLHGHYKVWLLMPMVLYPRKFLVIVLSKILYNCIMCSKSL